MNKLSLTALLALIVVLMCGTIAGANDISPLHSVTPIEGYLWSGEYDEYEPINVPSGGCVAVQVIWTPACSDVTVLLIRSGGLYRPQVVTLSGGIGEAWFCNLMDQTYHVVIRNDGPCTITYEGGIFVNCMPHPLK